MTFLIATLATYRVWRIQRYDISDLAESWKQSDTIRAFLRHGRQCAWCSGFWLSIAAGQTYAPGWFGLAAGLAISVPVGILGDKV